MNKVLILLAIFLFWGCISNKKKNLSENIKYGNHYVDEKQISKIIRKLVDSNKSDQALKLLDTLNYSNKQNGYLYFERGFVEGYNFHHEAAVKNFKMAENLHYNKKACEMMIDASQEAIIQRQKTLNEGVK